MISLSEFVTWIERQDAPPPWRVERLGDSEAVVSFVVSLRADTPKPSVSDVLASLLELQEELA